MLKSDDWVRCSNYCAPLQIGGIYKVVKAIDAEIPGQGYTQRVWVEDNGYPRGWFWLSRFEKINDPTIMDYSEEYEDIIKAQDAMI